MRFTWEHSVLKVVQRDAELSGKFAPSRSPKPSSTGCIWHMSWGCCGCGDDCEALALEKLRNRTLIADSRLSWCSEKSGLILWYVQCLQFEKWLNSLSTWLSYTGFWILSMWRSEGGLWVHNHRREVSVAVQTYLQISGIAVRSFFLLINERIQLKQTEVKKQSSGKF